MMRLLLPLLLLLPARAQEGDLPKRVRALVEQLQADEIQTVDDAVAALIALGAPALDPIRAELKKAGGDAKLRLEEAVRSIERNVKRARAMGTPILVTLDAKGKLLSDALEEIRTSTAQPIVFKDLPAEPVTVAFEKLGFWEALDRLCKAHGGVMWEVKEKVIVVSKRPYRDLPKVFRGNHIVYFERLSSDTRLTGGRTDLSLQLEGGFAWTQGSVVPRDILDIEEFSDDRGTDLRAKAAGAGVTFTLSEEYPPEPGHLVKALDFTENTLLHDQAAKISRLKGSVRLEYVIESRKLATFEKPAGRVGKPEKVGGITVTLKKYSVNDDDADVNIKIETATLRDKLLLRARGFHLIDSKGAVYEASGWIDEEPDEDTGKIEYDCDLEFSFPEGTVIVALEVTIPTDLEEVVIPFDFKDLPLK